MIKHNLLKKLFILLLLAPMSVEAQAQAVLFIGRYIKSEAGKNGWCLDRVLEKQVFQSEAEAKQHSNNFKLAHTGKSPVVQLVKNGGVVIFEFQYRVIGFNCSYRSYGWKTASSIKAAHKLVEAEKEKIIKEHQNEPKVMFEWGMLGTAGTEPAAATVTGINISLKLSLSGSYRAIMKNPPTGNAVQLAFVADDDDEKAGKAYAVEPGSSANIQLGKLKKVEVLLKPAKKRQEIVRPDISNQNLYTEKI